MTLRALGSDSTDMTHWHEIYGFMTHWHVVYGFNDVLDLPATMATLRHHTKHSTCSLQGAAACRVGIRCLLACRNCCWQSPIRSLPRGSRTGIDWDQNRMTIRFRTGGHAVCVRAVARASMSRLSYLCDLAETRLACLLEQLFVGREWMVML